MLILVDGKMPQAAKARLQPYGQIVDLATHGITYEAISGHPDIFFCPTPSGLIVAPNLPGTYFDLLNQNDISFTKGALPVGPMYPDSARYNTLVTERLIVQHPDISETCIHILNPGLETIKVRQGYVRCNLLALPNGSFIVSDRGIEKSLLHHGLKVLFVDPSCVRLDGFEHGFFGGACGMYENTLFVCGSLKHVPEKAQIEAFTTAAGVQLIELFDGPVTDVGTIVFLNP